MVSWIELLTKQFNSCQAACEVCRVCLEVINLLRYKNIVFNLFSIFKTKEVNNFFNMSYQILLCQLSRKQYHFRDICCALIYFHVTSLIFDKISTEKQNSYSQISSWSGLWFLVISYYYYFFVTVVLGSHGREWLVATTDPDQVSQSNHTPGKFCCLFTIYTHLSQS